MLWIKDFFFGGESYYICAHGEMNIENRLFNFISLVLNELGLEKCDCTFLGGSKGGSAALYYGLKYDIKNIIATVPQFYIGSYVEIDWQYAFKHMIGSLSMTDVEKLKFKLDCLIENQIEKSDKNKNIYLITSLADPQYKEQVENNISKLKKFSNFNLIYANSDLISRHNQVNRHIIPVTTSILSLTSMGMPPVFSNKVIKYRSRKDVEGYLDPFVVLKKFEVRDSKIYLEGISIIKGMPCPEYTDISVSLVLRNDNSYCEIGIAKNNVNALGKKYLGDDCSISYDKGWFCTKGYYGLPIDELPCGDWQVYIKINVRGVVREAMMISDQIFIINGVGYGKTLSFASDTTHASMKISKF